MIDVAQVHHVVDDELVVRFHVHVGVGDTVLMTVVKLTEVGQ